MSRAGARTGDLFRNSRRKFVLAARAEFAAKGYAGARMEQIADRAEVKKELIYHYFRGKEHLFEEVRAEQLADVEQCREFRTTRCSMTLIRPPRCLRGASAECWATSNG